jgi:DNA polymerase III subunit alpha
MPDLKKIKLEILDHIKNRNGSKVSDDVIKKVGHELSTLEITEGINGVNNLEFFYNIWQKNKNRVGKENKINSWTYYCLGITSKEPDGEFLPLRRAFARAGFPDIDTDFDDDGRDFIYEYLIDKYGRENVGNVGTHGMLQLKSCVRRVGKALDVAGAFQDGKEAYVTNNEAKVSEILSPFPKSSILKVRDPETKEIKVISKIKDAIKFFPDFKRYMDKYPELAKHSEHIEGTFAIFGVHASGFIISNEPIGNIAPLRTAGKGVLATQFPYEDLEEMGLIKFDVLSISTLTVIKRTVKMIKENYNIDIDITNLPMDDDKTFQVFRDGNLTGVFQCEEPGMQDTMKEIGVDSFNDIMAAVALYRPGPMDNIPSYCARKKGLEKKDYFHKSVEPFVKPILESTHSICVFQEQLMQICNVMANFSIADGYVMIKAVGKKKRGLMNKFKKQFIEGCVKNKISERIAEQYWDKYITPFAQYGFNLAHSAAYGLLAWITGYLKAYFPEEFVMCTLNVESERSHYEKIIKYEKDFQYKMSIKLLPRDINESKSQYVLVQKKNKKEGVEKTEIRRSLVCKGVGLSSAQHIEKLQPFKGLEDFARRIDSSFVDSRVVTSLAEHGYFTKSKKNVETIVKEFMSVRDDLKKSWKRGVDPVDIFEDF